MQLEFPALSPYLMHCSPAQSASVEHARRRVLETLTELNPYWLVGCVDKDISSINLVLEMTKRALLTPRLPSVRHMKMHKPELGQSAHSVCIYILTEHLKNKKEAIWKYLNPFSLTDKIKIHKWESETLKITAHQHLILSSQMVKSPLDDPVTKQFPSGENAQAIKEPSLTFPDLKNKSTQD
ncbi:hypothetical protein EK904_000587 [Melospiza melodia maxima]|nr:hypothetical protein EK904_000587 [Melospiza melodia maxima]